MLCGVFYCSDQELSGGCNLSTPWLRVNNIYQDEEAAKSGRHCNNVGSEGWKVGTISQNILSAT